MISILFLIEISRNITTELSEMNFIFTEYLKFLKMIIVWKIIIFWALEFFIHILWSSELIYWFCLYYFSWVAYQSKKIIIAFNHLVIISKGFEIALKMRRHERFYIIIFDIFKVSIIWNLYQELGDLYRKTSLSIIFFVSMRTIPMS